MVTSIKITNYKFSLHVRPQTLASDKHITAYMLMTYYALVVRNKYLQILLIKAAKTYKSHNVKLRFWKKIKKRAEESKRGQ